MSGKGDARAKTSKIHHVNSPLPASTLVVRMLQKWSYFLRIGSRRTKMSRIRNSTPYAGVLSTTVSTQGMRSVIEDYSYYMIYLSSTFTDNTDGEVGILLT